MHSSDPAELDGHDAAAGSTTPGFRHDALVYDDIDQLTSIAAPWLLEGLAAGDAAVIAVGPRSMAPLREAVGGDPRVMIVERHTLYRARTPTAITAFRRFAEQNAAPGRRVRVVGETDYGATAADWRGMHAFHAGI